MRSLIGLDPLHLLVIIGIALARIELSSLPNKVVNLVLANRVATTLL